MIRSPYIKRNIPYLISGISSLFILLFIYAATSKLVAFQTFTVQLAQSPLLSAYAGVIAWLIPGIEIVIAFLLLVPKSRTPALYAAFTLMVMFTAYIFIILHFSDFVPCSCGGVLEKLSWTQHLIFNVVFILLAVFAIFLTGNYPAKAKMLLLFALFFIGVSVITLFFVLSEEKMHRNNAFQRRYPHHPANEVKKFDLKYNSYYLAGITEDSIYLGNTTAPLHLLATDRQLSDTIYRKIKIPSTPVPFKALIANVTNSFLYLIDGTVPIILRGKVKNLKADVWLKPTQQFIETLSITDTAMVVRTFDRISTKNILGLMKFKDSIHLKNYPEILTAYADPFFDTDGILLYNEHLKKIIYVYYYRNEFVLINPNLTVDYIGKTIDTISLAQLDIRTIKSRNEKKFGKNPIVVNSLASTSEEFLFIASDRLGKYEEDIRKDATIIDVYNLVTQEYSFSFYLYHIALGKLKEFKVEELRLYAIIDHYLIEYELKKSNFKIHN